MIRFSYFLSAKKNTPTLITNKVACINFKRKRFDMNSNFGASLVFQKSKTITSANQAEQLINKFINLGGVVYE